MTITEFLGLCDGDEAERERAWVFIFQRNVLEFIASHAVDDPAQAAQLACAECERREWVLQGGVLQ